LAIKISLGKLRFEGGTANFIDTIHENGFAMLALKEEFIERVEALPLLHRDPFDRILVTSAISEGMSLISSDAQIKQYALRVIW
jgi:PIN domain nuclease of toxin-antitoxin system